MNNPLGKSWKTGLGALVAVLFIVCNYFGIEVPGVPHAVMDNGPLLALVGSLFFAKDSDVTGGSRKQ